MCRRVVQPWLGLKLIDLDDMIVANIIERNPAFPSISKGVLVSVVCLLFPIVSYFYGLKVHELFYPTYDNNAFGFIFIY